MRLRLFFKRCIYYILPGSMIVRRRVRGQIRRSKKDVLRYRDFFLIPVVVLVSLSMIRIVVEMLADSKNSLGWCCNCFQQL